MNWQSYVETKDIEALAKKAGVDIEDIDHEQIKMGIKAEKEHTGGDTHVVGKETDLLKVAVAHLREKGNYYTLLKKVEGED